MQWVEVVTAATQNAIQRRKSWTLITKELPFKIHSTSGSTILRMVGYTRAIAQSISRLSEKNTAHRLEFNIYWKDQPVKKGNCKTVSDSFDGWISTHEMYFIVGEHYGPELVIRLVREMEKYDKDCVNEERPGKTRIMFWGLIIYRVTCAECLFFIWEKETQEERGLALTKLAEENRLLEEASIKEDPNGYANEMAGRKALPKG